MSRVLRTGDNQITQGYSGSHRAVDLVKNKSQLDDITAHTGGKVVFCQTGQRNNKNATGNASYGNCVRIDHGNGYATLYAHLATVSVKLGDTVEQGQVLGRMGNTGRSFGAHLHFEVRKDNERIDPTPYLDADLPRPIVAPTVTYRARINGWLPWVTGYNNINADGYAGIKDKGLTALQVKPSEGRIQYRVHLVAGGWLPWVTGYNNINADGYAGVIGRPFDALQARLLDAPGFEVQYRVSSVGNSGWHEWCTGLTDATGDGYAGVFGKPIDLIQMTIVKK